MAKVDLNTGKNKWNIYHLIASDEVVIDTPVESRFKSLSDRLFSSVTEKWSLTVSIAPVAQYPQTTHPALFLGSSSMDNSLKSNFEAKNILLNSYEKKINRLEKFQFDFYNVFEEAVELAERFPTIINWADFHEPIKELVDYGIQNNEIWGSNNPHLIWNTVHEFISKKVAEARENYAEIVHSINRILGRLFGNNHADKTIHNHFVHILYKSHSSDTSEEDFLSTVSKALNREIFMLEKLIIKNEKGNKTISYQCSEPNIGFI